MSGPAYGPTSTFRVPTLNAPNLGPQSQGFQLTTGARPNQPDFTPYFGKPLREVKTNPYEAYARENYALPEAYIGPNTFITRVLIQLITEDDMWATRIALPFRFTEGEMEVAWSVWIFNNHGMDNVPEEGVSRLLSSEMQERRGSYVRYGLAFILEHGFMKTQKGQLCYQMNLMQIRNAILETLYYGAIEEYLMCHEYNNVWSRRHGMALSEAAVRDIMREEVENWACIHKSEGGWDLLDSRCKRLLQDAGHTPNMWVLPRGTKPYIALDKNATAYHLNGPSGQALLDSAKNGQNVQAIDTANNCQIFESKGFKMPEHTEPVDLLWRERSVGEYYLMVNHLPGYPMSDYKSCWRDIAIYNEARDQFNPITLRAALKHCNRFDGQGYLDQDGQPPPEDMFYYKDPKDDTTICRFFGDMMPDNLSKETRRAVAASLMNIIETKMPDFQKRYQAGLELIAELENGQITDDYLKYINNLVAKDENMLVPSTGMLKLPKPTPGVDILSNLGLTGSLFAGNTPTFVPVGYASFPGLQTLAMEENAAMGTYHTRAKDFVHVISTMYYTLSRSLFNSIFLDPNQRSPYFSVPDGRTTFFENLVSVPRPCVYVNRNAKANTTNVKVAPYFEIPDNLFFKADELDVSVEILDMNDVKDDEICSTFSKQTFGKFESMKKREKDATERLDKFLRAMELTAVQKKSFTSMIMRAFLSIIRSGGEKNDSETHMALAAKMFATLTSFTDRGKAVAYLSKIEPKNFFEEKNEAAKEAAAKVAVGANVVGATVVGATVVGATVVNQVNYVRTPLVASKRMIIQMMETESVRKVMLPSTFLNGMKPPEDTGSLGENEEGGVTDDLNPALLLIRSRMGAPGDGEYTLDATTPVTRDLAPIGAKRGREEEHDLGGPSKMRFGARYGFGAVSADEDREFERGYVGMNRNPGVIGSGVYRLFGKNFIEAFNETNRDGDDLMRVGEQAFLGTPIHRTSFERMIDNDIFFPMGFLVARPFITHLMGTAILTTSGAEVGETLVGHADFQLSDNVVQKMHYGNFTFYAKSIIYHPEKVLIVTDIISKRYIMGNDMQFFDENSIKSYMAGDTSGSNHKSILVMTIPADPRRAQGREYSNPIDLTGSMMDEMQPLDDRGIKHYASADYYKTKYHLDNQNSNQARDYFGYFPRAQTLCFQGMQWNWSPAASSLSIPIQNTGHWGYRVYEGCAAVRSGAMKMLRECNYSMYGGSGAVPSMPLGY